VQTDVGMTGPYDGVIGVQKELILHRFLTNMPARFEPATNDVRLCATLIDCNAETGARPACRGLCCATHSRRLSALSFQLSAKCARLSKLTANAENRWLNLTNSGWRKLARGAARPRVGEVRWVRSSYARERRRTGMQSPAQRQ